MLNLPGYQITEQLYDDFRIQVYRGIRQSDGKRIAIKLLKSSSPSYRDLMQLRHQYTLVKNLEIPGIIKPYSLETYGNSFALIMEDFGGISLSAYTNHQALPIEEFLPIAQQIVEILASLHHNRIIHKDIKPQNLLIHPHTKEIKLIDFSISSLLPKEVQEIQIPNLLEGTLAYIAPEQTGRMNRGIDYRSDFYSLGVTFYELLTGQLPCLSTDPMELIHCHIAKTPTPVIQLNPTIPQSINEIVLKLMAKTAENRYQIAHGIKHDLEICWLQWQKNQTILPFQLGQRDISDRFLIPEKLYGREQEVQTLLESFDRVAQGNLEILLVSGFSGIGKTAVINEVDKPIVRSRGYFIKGKFDQFNRNIPFSAFLQAFRNLMGQLLTENNKQLENWKAKILAVLGENAQVIIEFIPELERIIGSQPPVFHLSGNAVQNRFNLLFGKFIRVFATKEHPLVIFLDDLQWADSASLKLMQVLASEGEASYLLLIGAYRDNEVNPAHPLLLTLDEIERTGAKIQNLNLAPLSQTSINHLIADTLNCCTALALPLTEWIYCKTKGNPFFTNQFLKSLHQNGLISFDFPSKCWQCDLAQVRMLAIADDVVEFMAWQLQHLPETTQSVLKLAACIGHQFDLNTLATVYEKSLEETAIDLWKALQEGLIIPQNDIYKFFQESSKSSLMEQENQLPITNYQLPKYKFMHDRVQQAAYSLIPDEQKQATHLKIGQLLLNNTSQEELEKNVFEIVNHLNYGVSLISDSTERYKLVQLNLMAGKKAKVSTAYTAAVGYLKMGRELLAGDSWQTEYKTTLDLYVEAVEAAYLNTDFEQMQELANLILDNAKTLLDKIKVYEAQLSACTAQVQPKKAVEMGLEILNFLGVNFPAQPDVPQKLEVTASLFAGKKIADFINLPEMIEPEKQAALRILSSLVSPAYISAPSLLPLIILEMVQLSVNYGNAPLSAFAYGLYGLILSGVIQDIETGYNFGKLALNIVDKFQANALKTKIFYTVGAHLFHGKHHLKESLNLLREGYAIGLITGELETGYSAKEISQLSYLMGGELTELEQEIATYSKALVHLRQEAALNYNKIVHQAVLNLLEQSENTCHFVGEAYNEEEMLPFHIKAKDRNGLHYFYFHKMIICYLFGEVEQALENAEQAEQYLDAVTGMINGLIFLFYDSLIRLAVYPNKPESERQQYLLKVENNQEKMQKWADCAPMNFLHKFYLIEAEQFRVLNQNLLAMEVYDRAIALAKENGYQNEEALGNELAAKFYLCWNKAKIAQTYLTDAYYAYARWGSKAKVKDLEKRYPQLLKSIFNRETNTPSTYNSVTARTLIDTTFETSDALDLTTVIQASQAIASEIELDKLLTILMDIVLKNAGAQLGILILNREEKLLIEATITINSEKISVRQSILVDRSDTLPLSIINYVFRTHEDVILTDASQQGNFSKDPYIIANQTKSVLCAPILSQGKLIGILYIENNLISGAFTTERSQLLKLLCSQAAISLENARLYEAQKEYAKTLERQVQERTQELQQQKALFDAFFDASTAGFVIHDKNLRYVQVNEAIAQINGLSVADHIGKSLSEVVPHLSSILEPTFEEILTTDEPILNTEISGETASQPGVQRHWIVSYFPLPGADGKPMGVGSVVIEISDRKRAEEALRQSEERWQLALKGGAQAIWDVNFKTNQVFHSTRYEEMLGYEDEEIPHRFEEWLSRIHPDDINLVMETFQVHLERKSPYYITEHRVRCKEGTYKWVLSRGQAFWDEEGKPVRIVGSLTDITDRKRAEQTLQEQEEFLRSIYEGVEQAIFVVNICSDKEFRFAGWNRVGEAIVGVNSSQAVGKTPEEVFDSAIAATLRQNYTACVEAGTAITYEDCFTTEGSEIWSLTTLTPLRDGTKKIHRIIGTATNITARKKVEAALKVSEARYRRIIETSYEGVWMIDTDGRTNFVNTRMAQMLGYTVEEMLGKHFFEFMDAEGQAIASAEIERRCQGINENYDFRFHRKDGSALWAIVSTTAIFNQAGRYTGTLAMITDITKRKQAETALQKAKETADAASRAKGEFLSKMSHELRTPLNAILGFTQVLNHDPSLTSQQQEYLGIINRAGEHLLTLINDVLEMSKIEAGKVELRENSFDLHRLLDSLEEMFKLKAESKGLRLIFHRASNLPQYVKTDQSKLRQVLINLLGNAIKFTEKGSVTLQIKMGEGEENINYRLFFEVEDTGPGIAPEDFETLFDPFLQTETGRKYHSGTGLGLPISRQFVQLMAGDIRVSSTLGQGATFKFDIQISLAEATEIPPQESTNKVIGLAAQQPTYRILIVDDIWESRLLLVNLLSPLGFQVREAVNGQEAITVWEEWQPHLIWMDMQMPVMDGYETTKQIKHREKSKVSSSTVIIALTASAFEENRATVLASGCNDFVSKPFQEGVIFEKMAEHLGVRYLYEQQCLLQPTKSSGQLTFYEITSKDFAEMSTEWIAQLYEAASELNDELIEQLIEEIPETSRCLANSLEDLAKKLRFDKIVDLIEKLSHE